MRVDDSSYLVNCDAEGVSLESAWDPSVDESWEQHLWAHAQALTQTQREWFHCHSIWCTRPSVQYMAKTVNKAQGAYIIKEWQSYRSHTSYLQHSVPLLRQQSQVWDKWMYRERHTCAFTTEWTLSWIQGKENIHSLTYNWTQCIIKLTTWWCNVSSNPRFSDSMALWRYCRAYENKIYTKYILK